ncbi:transcriptional regulator [Streptomyces sp. NRRL B-24484]|uniref:transcriptional regulator n=1 Tax=Streptomyces sp. NRRL B-24484 TaxID=1463833 RepID=UPI002D21AF55|nr:transcriptional regulator [Streptomyces sp. NRRL B-24484]
MAIHLDTEVMKRGIKSPLTSKRGLAARLKYLTEKKGGPEAMAAAGITVKPRTLKSWLDGASTPRPDNLAKIDAAYWALKGRNLVPRLKELLDNDGAGTEIEIYPVDQSHVPEKHQRDIDVRRINLRGVWDDFVDAWLDEDADLLDQIWDEVLNQLGSDYDAYTYVEHVGFAVPR